MLINVVLSIITTLFGIVNAVCWSFLSPLYLHHSYVCVFMLLCRMVHTCQVQNIIPPQGMSDKTI